MALNFSRTFKRAFDRQIEFIARDKPLFALKFRNGLLKKLKRAAKNPQHYRKSTLNKEPNCHDVIYKGHTIIGRETKDYLEVLDLIYKQSFAPEDLQ